MGNNFHIKKQKTYKILMALFSLFCALICWIYVTETRGEYIEREFSGVTVVFSGASSLRETKELIITDVEVTTVTVTISGDRRTIANLEAADITAVIDVSGYTQTGTNSPSYRITYPSNIDASSLTIVRRGPETVTFYVDKLETRTVEVTGIFNGNAAEGCIVEPLEFSPSTVRVTGPKASLDEIAYAWIEVQRTDVDRTETFQSTYVLMDKNGNIIDDDLIELGEQTVTVTLPVVSVKEVPLVINFIAGGGATENDVLYTLEPSKITISGDSETLESINSITVATIDLGITDRLITDEVYTIVIPNDTQIISGAREAKLNLEIKSLSLKTITATRISCINITEGYEVKIIDESIEIIIRGKEEALRDVSANNIRVVADLSEIGDATGMMTVPVKIFIDGTTEVGAVGEYKINIEITR